MTVFQLLFWYHTYHTMELTKIAQGHTQYDGLHANTYRVRFPDLEDFWMTFLVQCDKMF